MVKRPNNFCTSIVQIQDLTELIPAMLLQKKQQEAEEQCSQLCTSTVSCPLLLDPVNNSYLFMTIFLILELRLDNNQIEGIMLSINLRWSLLELVELHIWFEWFPRNNSSSRMNDIIWFQQQGD